MSSIVAEKLYPPTIGSSIPAFYVEKGTALIAVPFSMNRAVDADSIGGLRLKIKTVLSNTYITSLTIDADLLPAALSNRIAIFSWKALNSTTNTMTPEFNKIKLGQFLKVQMAYIDKAGNVGYFSTVATVKYTSKPNVFIEDADIVEDNNAIPLYKLSYVGVYQATEDPSERPYSFIFYLYDAYLGLIETSDWKLHNSSINRLASDSLNLDRTIDTYSFTAPILDNSTYYILYGVKTINNLEIYSPLYPCFSTKTENSTLLMDLIPTNNFDEAYVELHLKKKSTIDPNISANYPISIEVSRASKLNNYCDWQPLTKAYFINEAEALRWTFKDFTIEQGIHYKYCYRLYNKNYIYSNREISEDIQADFEDMFLWDGEKQLKIRYNPKVTSFKTTQMELKLDTLGSRYPYIFKNGIVNYKEFPISGLITYTADNHEMFVDYETELNITIPEEALRLHSPEVQEYINTWNNEFSTTKMTGYNMRAERIFKMKTLEWLNNGKIKMFKSAAEGNYLVRLMNVSLTPEDKLGRMLHTVSMQAYEVEELTYANLLSLNFINVDDKVYLSSELSETTLLLRDIIEEKYTNNNSSILLNEFLIHDEIIIEPSPHSNTRSAFYVRIGEDVPENRVYIGTTFHLRAPGNKLPNIYFNPSDNEELLEPAPLSDSSCIDLVGDTTFTYKYYRSETAIGNFYNIDTIIIKNKVETFVGPTTLNFGDATLINPGLGDHSNILKFFVLEFEAKPCETKLLYLNNKYYDFNNQSVQISHFDTLLLYQVSTNTAGTNVKIYYTTDGVNLIPAPNMSAADAFYTTDQNVPGNYVYDYINLSVTLSCYRDLTVEELNAYNIRAAELYEQYLNAINNLGEEPEVALAAYQAQMTRLNSAFPPYEVTFTKPPIINLHDAISYNSILLSWGIYLKAAYQERVVKYIEG